MSVHVAREGAAIWIRWSRPERLNAWDGETLAALGAALAESARTDARAIVLRGEGGAFSSGDDLRETSDAHAGGEWAAALTGFNRLTRGGRGGAAAGDRGRRRRVRRGRLRAGRGLRRAPGDPGLALRLPRGSDRALDLERLQRVCAARCEAARPHGELVDAEEAQQLGLVDVVVDDVEAEARRLAERIASLAPLAVAGSKRSLDAAVREALERALDREAALCEQLFETADTRKPGGPSARATVQGLLGRPGPRSCGPDRRRRSTSPFASAASPPGGKRASGSTRPAFSRRPRRSRRPRGRAAAVVARPPPRRGRQEEAGAGVLVAHWSRSACVQSRPRTARGRREEEGDAGVADRKWLPLAGEERPPQRVGHRLVHGLLRRVMEVVADLVAERRYSRVMRMNSCQATSTACDGMPSVFPSA